MIFLFLMISNPPVSVSIASRSLFYPYIVRVCDFVFCSIAFLIAFLCIRITPIPVKKTTR